jgi:hypothetical protein
MVWALRDLEGQKVDFEETWAIPYEAFFSRDEVGVAAAGVEEGVIPLSIGHKIIKMRLI